MIAWTQHLRVTGEEPAAPLRLTIYDSAQSEQVTMTVTDPSSVVSGEVPLVSVSLVIGSTSWLADDLAGEGLTISETAEGSTWSAAVPMEDWPHAVGVRPTGAVSIVASWGAPGKRSTVTLLTGGRVTEVQSSWTPEGKVVRVSGLDASGHYDAQLVSGVWAPGDYSTRRDVVVAVLTAAGYTGAVIGQTEALRVSVEATEESPLSLCRRILEVEHQTLRFDRRGQAEIVPITWTDAVLVSGSLLIASGATAAGASASTGDGPDALEVEATIPTTTAAASGECEREVRDTTVDTAGLRLQVGADWYQTPGQVGVDTGAGNISAVSAPLEVEVLQTDPPLARTRVYQVLDCGEVIYERRQVWGWYWPLAWRYQLKWQVAWEPYIYGSVYFDSASVVTDDRQVGYVWPRPRFVLIQDQQTARRYEDGELVEEVTRVDGWRTIPAAIKAREDDEGVPWDELPYRRYDVGSIQGAARELGNGVGVVGDEEFGPISITYKTVKGDGGEITEESSQVYRYRGEVGGAFRYSDNTTSDDEQYSLDLDEVVVETPQPVNAASYQLQTLRLDARGNITNLALGGVLRNHRPPRPTMVTPSSSTTTKVIEFTEPASGGDRVEPVSITAGDEEEARSWAARERRRRNASTGSVTVPAGSLLRREIGQAITVDVLGSGLITEARHRAGSDGMISTLSLELQ